MKLTTLERVKPKENIWEGLKQGYDYLKHHRTIRAVILLMALTSFFTMPYSTLLPVFAKDVFKGDVSTFSWLNSISGLGALMGAIYMATLKPGRNLLKVIVFASGLFALCLALFSFSSNLPMALLFLLLGESGMLAQIAATNTFIQTHVDEHMRGRVISYYVMAFQGMQPIGSFLIGFMAHQVSAQHTVSGEGIIGFIIILFFIPYIKRQKARQEALNVNHE
jgi:predicted MFS family arabinose efflux permease